MKGKISLATIALAATFGFNGCGHKAAQTAGDTLPAATVRTQTVESKSRTATEDVVGTVRAKLRSVIEAKVSGKIGSLLVAPGQTVTAGQTLATIDAGEVQARLDQALAIRQQAEADLKRFASLLEQKILAQSEFDTAQARFRVADASVREGETLLGYTKVVAPFAGIITRKHADVGDLATPGKPLLEMEDPHTLRLEADVPEAAVGRLTLGDKLPVRVSGLSSDLEGVVSEISPAADAGSRTFLVKCDLPPVTDMRTGQFGRVAIPIGETSALRVPASAVVRRGQMELVFVVADGHAQLRIVKTGKRVGDEVEVVSGVDGGEKIVVEGTAGLTDGQPVQIR